MIIRFTTFRGPATFVGKVVGVLAVAVIALLLVGSVCPEVLRPVRPGRTILARIERDGAAWSLFAVRVLGDLKN